jgi:hypothetical protein
MSMTFHHNLPNRREALLGAGALFAWSQMPRLARAEGRDPRLLVIVLRGALDGLGAVAPVGDPDWVGLRGDRALVLDGKTPGLPLDTFFALNPAMPNLHRLYKAQQASIVHATATPYRERSHFDGQDVLESGIARPGAVDSGWLNRALVALESDGQVDLRGGSALGVGAVTPLIVRGRAPVMSWVPQKLLPASDDTRARLLDSISTPIRNLQPRSMRGYVLRHLGRPQRSTIQCPKTPRHYRLGSRACVPMWPRSPVRPRAFLPRRTARVSERRALSGGIRTSTKVRPPVNSPTC